MSKQALIYTACPECESKNLVMDMEIGELVCGNCGLVIEENILNQ
ncbi:MAG: hypothetical protein OEY90_06860, partial [Candidatus Bathyarchaeota archaeon]|nr:hypothetical protein [Candidatus Bathyarchaeota archaeon]